MPSARSWDEDEAQPLLFLCGVLTAVVIPWTMVLLEWLHRPGRREVLRAFPETTTDGLQIQYCQTAAMVAKREAEMIRLRSRWATCSAGFLCRCGLLCILWAWQGSVVVQWRAAQQRNLLYEGFDPYHLLGVEPGADHVVYSRAFRREAVKWHPDKSTHPEATQRFLLAQKAFETLTDPAVMANFETYGNPDGPQFVKEYLVPSFCKRRNGADHLCRTNKVRPSHSGPTADPQWAHSGRTVGAGSAGSASRQPISRTVPISNRSQTDLKPEPLG